MKKSTKLGMGLVSALTASVLVSEFNDYREQVTIDNAFGVETEPVWQSLWDDVTLKDQWNIENPPPAWERVWNGLTGRNAMDVLNERLAAEEQKRKQEERDNDPRQIYDTKLGGEYETVGITRGGCTVTDLGDGVALSGAHCFVLSGVLTKKRIERPNGFSLGIKAKNYDETDWSDRIYADVEEVAIPRGYRANVLRHAGDEKAGYDIAFVRYKKKEGWSDGWPTAHFSLASEMKGSSYIEQVGASSDRGGLTGGKCKALDETIDEGVAEEDKNYGGEFRITTNCFAKPGDSGSPLFNENNEIIGIAESISPDSNWKNPITYVTPITPGLKAAFEAFQRGELDGEEETLPNGTKLIRFDYEREPVNYVTPDPAS